MQLTIEKGFKVDLPGDALTFGQIDAAVAEHTISVERSFTEMIDGMDGEIERVSADGFGALIREAEAFRRSAAMEGAKATVAEFLLLLDGIPGRINVLINVDLKGAGAGLLSGHSNQTNLSGAVTGFAHGGNFGAGQSLLVGERGPEKIMFPQNAGTVIPNNELSGGGGDMTDNDRAFFEDLFLTMPDSIKDSMTALVEETVT